MLVKESRQVKIIPTHVYKNSSMHVLCGCLQNVELIKPALYTGQRILNSKTSLLRHGARAF